MNYLYNNTLSESGICTCCNAITMSAIGKIKSDKCEICDYLVRWTKNDHEHPVGIFIISHIHDVPVGISIEYRFRENGFMIVDSGRFEWPKCMIKEKMRFFSRKDVLGNFEEKWAYNILDMIWLKDENIPKMSDA